MVNIAIKVLDKNGQIRSISRDDDEASLVYTGEYEEGDKIVMEISEKNIFLVLQVDEVLGKAFVYAAGNIEYPIPFGEKRSCYSPKAFTGDRHLITARTARKEEIAVYKNLALNAVDRPGATNYYPHASANVETRGEAVFAARNAIDGVTENLSHGDWPYQSWGINRREDAAMTIEFGRKIVTDRVRLYTRADFPHDNWWKQVTLCFSDDTKIEWELKKSTKPHEITFEPKTISWVRLQDLIKSEDPSPFPALTQIEVYGIEKE